MLKWSYLFFGISFISLYAMLYPLGLTFGRSSAPTIYAFTILIPIPAIIFACLGIYNGIMAHLKTKRPESITINSPIVPIVFNVCFLVLLLVIFVILIFNASNGSGNMV